MKTIFYRLSKQLRELNYKEILSILFLLYASLFNIITGFFLMISGDAIAERSDTYRLMQNLMNMDTWGLFFIVSGVLLFIADFQETKAKFINMIIGGTIGAIVLFLYASASFEVSLSYMLPARYAMAGCFNLFIALLGGLELWKIKVR
ncbi:hypothetical protein [Listeria booriae]|uniref:hypothetical protein n=1 Tax=Listeria booriae TaxID=1552123 RepID=UPI00162414AC|nr:hypothetical protein [Listeria booriae]MBC2148077.1 hypothetical protein [Listeria booriae]MBC2391380.1 hypothetical protein [Listeria booriae]